MESLDPECKSLLEHGFAELAPKRLELERTLYQTAAVVELFEVVEPVE